MHENHVLLERNGQYLAVRVTINPKDRSPQPDDYDYAASFLSQEVAADLGREVASVSLEFNQWLDGVIDGPDKFEGGLIWKFDDPRTIITYQFKWGFTTPVPPDLLLSTLPLKYLSVAARAQYFLAYGGDVNMARAAYQRREDAGMWGFDGYHPTDNSDDEGPEHNPQPIPTL